MKPRIELPKNVDSLVRGLPVFDGFPYLATRVVPALYHIILLPAEWSIGDLQSLAERQVSANRLRTCLVISDHQCVFYEADETQFESNEIPRGGNIISELLKAPVDFPISAELSQRSTGLQEHQQKWNSKGYVLGDLTKGGQPATTEEVKRLDGEQAAGVPLGLVQCATCGEWKGRCLDVNPDFHHLVVVVCCRCDNDNRCACCNRFLYTRKLNANYYENSDGNIWHVPGFCGFGHKCPE